MCVPANSVSIVNVSRPHRKSWKLIPEEVGFLKHLCRSKSVNDTVPVDYPTNPDICIPAETRLRLITACAIEPRPRSEIEFIQTYDRELTIVQKDDVVSVNRRASFDMTTLIHVTP